MKKYEHLPFEVILSATEGDPEAIETVMKFYDGYISKLCLRKLYDEYGNVCICCPTLWICRIVKSANLLKFPVLTSSITEQKHLKQ